MTINVVIDVRKLIKFLQHLMYSFPKAFYGFNFDESRNYFFQTNRMVQTGISSTSRNYQQDMRSDF